jgi:flagellar basal-body rod protein FlgC
MSLFNLFDVAGTAMSAQSIRLNTTASNLANADSVSGSELDVYRARHPIFSTVLADMQQSGLPTGGVQVQGIVESDAEVRREYNPNHPMANKDGYIFHSNVEPIAEMANMMAASRSYQNNVEIANTSKRLLLRTLQLGK